MNKNSIIKKITKLYHLYQNGGIPTLAQHEVNPNLKKSSRENYLYFTLPPCINFQRNSPAMWQSALATWNDPMTNYLFFPERVIKKKIQTIRADLSKHKLGIQPHKHTAIWTAISSTLHTHFKDDPRELLKAGEFNVERILTILQIERKDLFPYLRGTKMANYWLMILSKYTDAKFKNMKAISIIPDTHVIQCSAKLGITPANTKPETVAIAWKEVLGGTNINPVDMHPVLWNWSRNNFMPKV